MSLDRVVDAHGVKHVAEEVAGVDVFLCELSEGAARRSVAWFRLSPCYVTCLFCAVRLVPGLSSGSSVTMHFRSST